MIKIKPIKQSASDDSQVTWEQALAESVKFKAVNIGQDFDEFLAEEGILEEVKATSIKRVIAFQLQKQMQEKGLTKIDVAKRMKTSRSQLDRILDPNNKTVKLDLIIRAAHCVGRKFSLTLA
jgi:antitoxin HicB